MTDRAAKGFLLLSLAACGSLDHPWTVDWNGHPALPGVDVALAVIAEEMPCRGTKMGDLEDVGGRITWYDKPFWCPGVGLANGCLPDGPYLPSVAVGWMPALSDTALAEEMSHYWWGVCGWDPYYEGPLRDVQVAWANQRLKEMGY